MSDAPAAAAPLVSFKGISKSFGPVQALKDVNFDLGAGEVHALLGQNGAGKSTLIKILAGVQPRDAGRIEIEGREVDFHTPAGARAAGVAVVYQELSLVPSMTVADNIFLMREPNRFGIVERRRIVKEARRFLDDYGFKIHPQAVVGDLPFAYRQLTEIAKALMGEVRILVLDEPTSSLSSGEEVILFDAVAEVTKRGVGVIYVTHRLGEVFRLAQRVTVLRDGVNVATFRTAETSIPALVAAIVGPSSKATAAELDTANGATKPTGQLDAPRVELISVHNERLRGVDLKLYPGEILGLAGMIGSGRTEILETIFGLRRIVRGELKIDGKPARMGEPLDAIRRGIALVPEDRHLQGLVLDHSIERNVAMPRLGRLGRFGLFMRGRSRARALDAMRELSIKAPHPSTPARALSGGNQQKVVFGKWRDPTPDVLLLDEPTLGVDVGAREQIYGVIRRAAAQGSAVLVISSDLGELAMLCDRICIVANGRIKVEAMRGDIEGEEQLHHLVQEARA